MKLDLFNEGVKWGENKNYWKNKVFKVRIL